MAHRRTRNQQAAGFAWFVIKLAFHVVSITFLLTVLFDTKTRHMKPFTMLTNGMAPSIKADDKIMAENGSLNDTLPGRGDVVVFLTRDLPRLKAMGQTVLIQRVAALDGDKVELQPGQVLVNGEEFVARNEFGTLHYDGTEHRGLDATFIVPPGHVFTLGDNSSDCNDGRYWGFVPQKNIVYRAWFCYWPPSRMGPIH